MCYRIYNKKSPTFKWKSYLCTNSVKVEAVHVLCLYFCKCIKCIFKIDTNSTGIRIPNIVDCVSCVLRTIHDAVAIKFFLSDLSWTLSCDRNNLTIAIFSLKINIVKIQNAVVPFVKKYGWNSFKDLILFLLLLPTI